MKLLIVGTESCCNCTTIADELRNSHGGMPRTGTGVSYLCYSKCDVIKAML